MVGCELMSILTLPKKLKIMSNKKKNNSHIPAEAVNNVAPQVKRVNHEAKQKDQGDKIVKIIFGALIVLAVLYIIWSFFIVQ